METFGLEKIGITNPKAVYRNLSPAVLTETAVARGEGSLSDTGALVVLTGKYTGRSPHDKFIVDTPAIHDKIAWGKVNVPIEREKFNAIKEKMFAYLQNRELFVFDGFAGADPSCRKKFRIVNELAAQNLFIHVLLIRPTEEELKSFGCADFTVVVAPGFQCVPEVDGVNSEAAILIDYEAKMVLIAGTQYSGEIKKSVFSVMNFVMPEEGILPMHCSANMDPQTKDTAVFFGLSGTGKTTLSADPNRMLIGDDEHGWSDRASSISRAAAMPNASTSTPKASRIYTAPSNLAALWKTSSSIPDTRKPDYDDNSLTENTRVGYPIEYISQCGHPRRRRHPEGRHLPHGRQLRRSAPDLPSSTRTRPCTTS
jgi:phosphoenolpyruvate carboxykinase (ATP)